MPDPRGPLYEGHPQDLLSPYELAQAYRKVNPRMFDDLDDAELVRAIKKADPETYKLMDPLLEGSELLLARRPTAPPPPPPQLVPPTPQLTGGDQLVTMGLRTIPAIGGAIIGSAGGPLGTAGGGIVGSGLGETAAQWYEKSFGPREEYSVPAIVFEAGLGALNPAMRAATIPGRIASSAAFGGGLAAVGGPGRTLIEEGQLRAPSLTEIGTGAVLGGATHAGFEGVAAARRAAGAGLGDLTGAPPAAPPGLHPDMTPADLGPLQAAVRAQYEAEEAVLASRLTSVFGPDAARPGHAPDYHTALQAKSYLEEIAAARAAGNAVPPVPPIDPFAGAPASDLATGQIVPQQGPFAPSTQRLLPEFSESIPPPTTEGYTPSPITSLTDQLQRNLNAPPGPPRLVPPPLELAPPPVPRETPEQPALLPPPRPSTAGPIEQGPVMGGRPPTPEQPRIPGVETPALDRPYATGPNAGPRRKGEQHGAARPIRRQVQTGKRVSYETVPSTLMAEDPGTYPADVRRELAAMAWELESFPHERIQGGTSMEAAQHLVNTNQARDIAEAIAMLRQRGATAGGAIAGAPVYHEVITAAKGANAHISRADMLKQIRAALLEGRGTTLSDAAAQVARRRLGDRATGLGRGTTIRAQRGDEGDDLIGWIDEAGNQALPPQDLDEFARSARDASDSEIMTALRWQDAGEPITPGTEGFFDAARNEAVRRGLIRPEQPGLDMLGPGGEGGPKLFDFEGGPPEGPTTSPRAQEEAPPPPPTALSELTARRKRRAMENAAQQEDIPPPPSSTPEQAAANAASRAERERELVGGGPLPPPIPAQARLPHEFWPPIAGLEPTNAPSLRSARVHDEPTLPGLEDVRATDRPMPEVADVPFSLTPPPAKPGKAAKPPRGRLLDRLLDEQGVLIFDIPPGDRTGLKKFLKASEKEHGGEAWFSRAEQAIDEGDWDRAWKAAAGASLRSYTKAADAATTPQQIAALEASVRGTPLQDDLRTQIVAGARTRAGVGEQPKGTGYPPTKRVTQAGAARGKATVGPAGILNPGARQRPLSSIAPELRAATLDRAVVRLIKEELEGNEELIGQLATVPGNMDTYIRLFRQIGEQVYKGENLKLLREAGVDISNEELAQHFNATISDAGRTLQMLSAFAQAHAKVLNEAAGRMDIGGALAGTLGRGGGPPTYVGARARVLSPSGQQAAQEVVDQVAERTSQYHANALARDMQRRKDVGPLRALHDASYAWMLSKWNTAVRNYASFTGRYGVDSLDHALTIPVARILGDESAETLSRAMLKERGFVAPGRRGTAVTPWSETGAWSDDLQHIYNFTTESLASLPPDDARRAIRLLLDVPEQAAHFLGRATGEDLAAIGDYSRVPVMRHLVNPKVQRVLTMFNRAQEFSARATVFDATTRALIRAKGLDPSAVLVKPIEQIVDDVGGLKAFDDLIGTATAQALEATFAGRTSRDSLPGALIRFINEAWPAKLGIPFPRFNLSAAPRWIYDHSPAALLDWVRFPLDRAGITAPKGTLAGGRLYRGVRSQEIQQVDLPLLTERITVAERAQGESLRELLGTQREFQVRQRQVARLEARAQQGLPNVTTPLQEARRALDQLGRRRETLKSAIVEKRTVVKDLQSQQKKLLDRVADATGINAPNYAQSLARMATGTVGMLGAAWVIRSQDGAQGTRWYEYRVDRGEGKDPIILDFRPFAPFAQYLFVADVLNDFYRNTDWQGVHQDLDAQEGIAHGPIDWANAIWNRYEGKYTEQELGSQFGQAFLSISRAAGTTLTLTDLMTQNGWPSLEDASRAVVGTIGQFFSRFTVPGQQVSDVLTAPFSEEEAKIRTPPKATTEEWTHPLAAPFANVPFAKQLIPERISQTTGRPVATEYPLLRGLLGIGTTPRDFVVEEVRRIGVPGQSVYIQETGDYGLDRTIAESYSTILREELPSILESDTYQQLGSPALQRDFLQRSIFPVLKRVALAEARTVVGSERFTGSTVRGEEARRRDRQQRLLDALESELPPEETEPGGPPGPPPEAGAATAPPPPPPF